MKIITAELYMYAAKSKMHAAAVLNRKLGFPQFCTIQQGGIRLAFIVRMKVVLCFVWTTSQANTLRTKLFLFYRVCR